MLWDVSHSWRNNQKHQENKCNMTLLYILLHLWEGWLAWTNIINQEQINKKQHIEHGHIPTWKICWKTSVCNSGFKSPTKNIYNFSTSCKVKIFIKNFLFTILTDCNFYKLSAEIKMNAQHCIIWSIFTSNLHSFILKSAQINIFQQDFKVNCCLTWTSFF